MFSIDLVTFFYKYLNCITVTTYQKSEPARTFENENCVCVRDHDDVWFIAKKNDTNCEENQMMNWYADVEFQNEKLVFTAFLYYLFLLFIYFFKCVSFQKEKKYLRYRYVLMKQNVKEYLWLYMARLHDMLHSLITLWKSEYN